MADLILKGGRVFDPGKGLDVVADVAFSAGKVAAIQSSITPEKATSTIDVTGKIVVPGIIDLHTHVYWGGTSMGVEAEPVTRRSGTTTFVDAGSAGPGNFPGFRRHVIATSPVRILAYLNVSYAGIFAFSSSVMVGECADFRLLDLGECVRVARENSDVVVGIKVRVGRGAGGSSGVAPLDMAIEAAEELGLPVMAHLDYPPPNRRDVLSRLRPGDILTHCFRPFPNAPTGPRSVGVREEVMAARRRGVIFDIGHGAGSFSFDTTRGMLNANFMPDVISSDIHVLSINGPAHDILEVMSKFHCLGAPLADIVKTVTSAPALALRRPELGTLVAGGIGDAAVLEIVEGDYRYVDVTGETINGRQRLVLRGVVVAGRWWDAAAQHRQRNPTTA
jgi:dihydroorotase